MGNISGKTSERQREWLAEHHLYQCKEAAQAILEADMFLLHIGAGFSADSGLAVYRDIADVPIYHKLGLEYHDLCSMQWMAINPSIFYGFWGKCFNDYRTTQPHRGYQIIQNWRKKYFSRSKHRGPQYLPNEFSRLYNLRLQKRLKKQNHGLKLKEDHVNVPIDPFFIFSSNVDSHPQKAGFGDHEIYEIHGSLENWQCATPDNCESGSGSDLDLPTAYSGGSFSSKDDFMQDMTSCDKPKFWKAPDGFLFQINEEMMIAEDIRTSIELNERNNGFRSNFPRCIHCNGLARPNVLMFGDKTWICDDFHSDRFSLWRKLALSYCSDGKKLVILEIGCGVNVPTVRGSGEQILNAAPEDSVTLIRVNPDYPLLSQTHVMRNRIISIQGKGLETIDTINEFLEKGVPPQLNYSPATKLYDSDEGEEDFESDHSSESETLFFCSSE